MRVVLLLLPLLFQDPSALLERLRSDDVREREAATRQLESLSLAEVERLQAQAGSDLEVRERLRSILVTLKKRAELAKVFGPTRRVTASFKDRRLDEVLRELAKALQEPIETDKIDGTRRIDLELKGATLWETLDAVEKAGGLQIEYGETQILARPGPRGDLPSKTVEQFKLGIGELKRMEYRAPGRSDQAGLVSVYVSHQRNLSPVGGHFREGIAIDSAVDAAGDSVRIDRVDWSKSWSIGHTPFTRLESFMVRSGKGPFTIEGKAVMRFEVKSVELSVPMADGKRKAKYGEVEFEVKEVLALPASLSLTLEVRWEGEDVSERLKEAGFRIVDGEGKSHEGQWRSGGKSPLILTRELVFPAKIDRPDRLAFSWITEFHLVELPFRFEGLQIP